MSYPDEIEVQKGVNDVLDKHRYDARDKYQFVCPDLVQNVPEMTVQLHRIWVRGICCRRRVAMFPSSFLLLI